MPAVGAVTEAVTEAVVQRGRLNTKKLTPGQCDVSNYRVQAGWRNKSDEPGVIVCDKCSK